MSAEHEEAPQDLDAKLRVVKSSGGRARCNMHHLTKLHGGVKVLAADHQGPTLVEVCPMDKPARWKRVSKDVFEAVPNEEASHG